METEGKISYEGRQILQAITVDIEDWYHIPSFTGSPFSKFKNVDEFFGSWTGRYDYLTEPTIRVLEILDELEPFFKSLEDGGLPRDPGGETAAAITVNRKRKGIE